MDGPKLVTHKTDTHKVLFWKESVEKEQRLRLRWFSTHKHLFMDNINAPSTNEVTEAIKDELRKTRRDYHKNREYFPVDRKADGDVPPPLLDSRAVQEIMRPVDPQIKKIIYDDGNLNRVKYLNERIHLIPEKRYYIPETTNFRYGWNMWECAKNKPNYGFGRCQIIKQSFYRRRGVAKDPEWYKEPEKLSPGICGCL